MRTVKEEIELRIKEAEYEVQRLKSQLESIPQELHNVEVSLLTRLHDFFSKKTPFDVVADSPNPGSSAGGA